jgi:hypothetical protein
MDELYAQGHRKVTRIAIAIALITAAISIFWSHRVRAAEEAAEFAPVAAPKAVLSAATIIEATIANGIASSAKAGESVTALVSTPVLSNRRLVIPPGAQLEGDLQAITVLGTTVKAVITFGILTVGDRSVRIETRPIIVAAPARSDTAILMAALKMIFGAGIGAGIGASSRDEYLLEEELLKAARASLSVEFAVPITVSLTRDIEI